MAAINQLALHVARLDGKIDAVLGMIPKMTQFDEFAICAMPSHPTHLCPSREFYSNFSQVQVNLMNSYNQKPRNPFSNAYNSAWTNHPNLSWESDNYLQNPASSSFQPKADSSLEDIMEMLAQNTLQFQQSTNNMLQSHSATISKMETQLGQIADALTQSELRKFPSQTIALQRNHEEAKAITMLRNGKLIDNGVYNGDSNSKSVQNVGASQEDTIIEKEKNQPPQNSGHRGKTKSDSLLHKAEKPYVPPIPSPVQPGDALEVALTKPPNQFNEKSELMEDCMDPLIAQVVDSWDFKVP